MKHNPSLLHTSHFSIDDTCICTFEPILNEKNIISILTKVQTNLERLEVSTEIVDSIFHVLVELLQNALHYALDRQRENTTKAEAPASLAIHFDTQEQSCCIVCTNTIVRKEKENIQRKIQELQGLSETELRKLARTKMRTKKDVHAQGAGLGFIRMMLHIHAPIETHFKALEENSLSYSITLRV